MERLPEDCVAHVISLTSPKAACRAAAVSAAFRSVSDSDAVWERFLPSDWRSVLSRAVDGHVSFDVSKKQLFLQLCNQHVLLDDGKVSFGLERSRGAKCYMLSARALSIIWGDTPIYWSWVALPDSRFAESAELLSVCWFEIRGKIEGKSLSPKTTYAAFLIYKLSDHCFGLRTAQEALVTFGNIVMGRTVYLEEKAPESEPSRPRGVPWWRRRGAGHDGAEKGGNSVKYPKVRQDGWMELELGEFYNDKGEDGEVDICLRETKVLNWKRGLIIQGMEIRPKN